MNPLGEKGRIGDKKPNPGKSMKPSTSRTASSRIKTRRSRPEHAQPLVQEDPYRQADYTSSWHRFIRSTRRTSRDIVM